MELSNLVAFLFLSLHHPSRMHIPLFTPQQPLQTRRASSIWDPQGDHLSPDSESWPRITTQPPSPPAGRDVKIAIEQRQATKFRLPWEHTSPPPNHEDVFGPVIKLPGSRKGSLLLTDQDDHFSQGASDETVISFQ